LFINIAGNALKHSKKDPPPVINITSHLMDKSITIKVRDNGIGFDQNYKEKISGLFKRLHNKDQFPGTGIGLSICKKKYRTSSWRDLCHVGARVVCGI
jgi:light-regulated signal transduction histidine kinase (bacteriophytochrome)